MTQIKSSTINLSGTYYSIINEIIILIGVICGLVYFFFSKEHTGIVGKVSRIGVYFLMIKFGASFGFAVMGRISLLIGRFEELIKFLRTMNNVEPELNINLNRIKSINNLVF